MILFSHFQALNQIEIHQNGAIRLAPNLLRLFGSVPKSKIVTMSAFILHGTLYGRFSRLCQETSEMSGMPSGTSYSVRRNTRITNQLYITKILGTTCRNYRLDLKWRICLHFIQLFVYTFPGELPDPNADAIMARCAVCSEKAYVNPCAHCDKKCCDDCREAHCDILKREISRVNNQVKRGWHRLEDCIGQVDIIALLITKNFVKI